MQITRRYLPDINVIVHWYKKYFWYTGTGFVGRQIGAHMID